MRNKRCEKMSKITQQTHRAPSSHNQNVNPVIRDKKVSQALNLVPPSKRYLQPAAFKRLAEAGVSGALFSFGLLECHPKRFPEVSIRKSNIFLLFKSPFTPGF